MVVGEPTSNYPLVGHKGSLKFHARFKGVSAHGSMPELGVNAIYKAAQALRGSWRHSISLRRDMR